MYVKRVEVGKGWVEGSVVYSNFQSRAAAPISKRNSHYLYANVFLAIRCSLASGYKFY